MYGQIGIAGYTNAFAALERDSATIAGSGQLDALIALERIGTRRSYFSRLRPQCLHLVSRFVRREQE